MWNELGISGGTAKRKRAERTWIGFRRSITSSLWNRLKGSIICSIFILFLILQWQ